MRIQATKKICVRSPWIQAKRQETTVSLRIMRHQQDSSEEHSARKSSTSAAKAGTQSHCKDLAKREKNLIINKGKSKSNKKLLLLYDLFN